MPLVLLAVAEKNVTPGHGSIGFLSMYLLISRCSSGSCEEPFQPVPMELAAAPKLKVAAAFAKDANRPASPWSAPRRTSPGRAER